ncbi:L,D-transpeptidase [Rhizobiales bacterium TNE-4]|nr:L,D-transpeptidase [Rhizobiales bacterium TNE-4]MBV1826428.1 L,D-transpeptidase [Rhizobiales bacterium TNE-4]
MIRRLASLMFAGLALAACRYEPVPEPALSAKDQAVLAYAPTAEVHLPFERYKIDNPTGEQPGTIVVDTKNKFLYWIEPNGKAIRYGVTVGDEAFGWAGEAKIQRKAEWPDWTPPPEMVKRWPHVKFTKGGPENPLGARALYLYDNGRDTLYRIHGTNEPEKIGQAVSSGCIRMRNIDVIDLYSRVPMGTRVVVL